MPLAVLHTLHEELGVPGGLWRRLELRIAGEPVPAILQVPAGGTLVPAALLLHGYSSRVEVMADSVGQALLQRGVASLALDLPLHGTRGNPLELQALRNPWEVARLWRLALREAAAAVDFLQRQENIHAGRVGIVGYSLGSFLAVSLAPHVRALRAVVLAAGGDLPLGTPLTAVARTIADPLRAVKRLDGRPLLMVNGRLDPVILPEQSQRLFTAAREPKEIRWWNVGHALSNAAIEDAAAWLARHLHQTAEHAD